MNIKASLTLLLCGKEAKGTNGKAFGMFDKESVISTIHVKQPIFNMLYG